MTAAAATKTSQQPKDMKTFFIIWTGQLVSMLGTNLTSFGLGVWIYEQTGRATPFAMTALFATLPGLFLSPIAGVFADRYNRRKLMILADTGGSLLALGAARKRRRFGMLLVLSVYPALAWLLLAYARTFG